MAVVTLSLHTCSLTLRVPWERGQRCHLCSVGHGQCMGTAGVSALPRVGSTEQRAVVTPPLVALTRCQPRWLSPSRCPPAGLLRFEVPSLHVSPEAALCRDPPEAAQRLSGPSLSPRQEEEEEEESESTAL